MILTTCRVFQIEHVYTPATRDILLLPLGDIAVPTSAMSDFVDDNLGPGERISRSFWLSDEYGKPVEFHLLQMEKVDEEEE